MSNTHTYHTSFKEGILLPLASQASANTAYVSPFALSGYSGVQANNAVFKIYVGAITQNVSLALFQATDSSGTGRKAISGASITAFTSATDLAFKTIEILPGALDDTNGFRWVRAEVTVAAAASELYMVVLQTYRLRLNGTVTQPSTYTESVLVTGR